MTATTFVRRVLIQATEETTAPAPQLKRAIAGALDFITRNPSGD
jgi:hypothetical protein